MKKIFLFSFNLLFLSLFGFGQIKISGKVIDSFTKEPIQYAVVSVHNKNTITDQLGKFELLVTSDTCNISISFVGYHSQQIKIHDLPKPLVIELKHGPVDLKEVKITAHSNNISFHTTSSVDLNLRPANSAQDLLRLVPGLFIAQHMGGGKAEQIFLRGFDADHGTDVNISVDGMPVNMVSHAHGQGYADMHFIIPETVSQYDFGKGPYYTGYGDLTTAGYVSYTTADVLNKSLIKIEAGQFNTMRAVAAINLLSDKAKLNGQNAYIAGEANYLDGPFNFPEHFNRFNLFGKYDQRIDNTHLSISVSTFSSKWRASGEIPERAVASGTVGFDTSGNKLMLNAPPIIGRFGTIDSLQGGNTKRSNVNIQLTTSFKNNFILQNQLYYTNYYFLLHVNSTFFAEDSINGDALKQYESRNLIGYNGKLINKKDLGKITLTSILGIGARIDRTTNSELSNTIDQNTVLKYDQLGDISENNFNAYVDENIETGKWLFNVGSRIDYLYFHYNDKLNAQLPSRSNFIASPKINIQYTLNSTVQFYLKSGKGFHSNDARAVVFNNGLQTLPAAYGMDVGATWKPLPRLLINTALWYLYLQQEFVYSDDGTVEPGDKTRRMGIDVSARYQLNNWLFADANVNLAKPRDAELPDGENYLPLAPTFTSTGGLDFKFSNGINGAISYRYLHKRPGNEDYTLTADGYFVSDLTLNYTTKKYEVGIAIENLFNTKWNEFEAEEVTKLKYETQPVDQMSFTPGTPFFAKLKLAVFF